MVLPGTRILQARTSPQLTTPVKVDRLEPLLVGYDSIKKYFLIDGFKKGFRLYSVVKTDSLGEAPNLISAQQNPKIVDEKLKKELETNRLAGPFDEFPFDNFVVSPLGIVPKKTPGEFRMIHHLSYPKGSSVNDGIDDEYSSVKYARIEDAIKCIKANGENCYLAKTDIKHAFRILPIHPDDYHLLGMRWKGSYYYDKCMPMGCASSCKTFEAFSTAIEWIAKNVLGIENIIHILDDFLICEPTYDLCKNSLGKLLKICEYLGIPMAQEKTFGPLKVMSFVGIELDTEKSEARLPADKLTTCLSLIENFLTRKKVMLNELQSLIGTLNFACSVVVPGRAFLRRLIDLTIGVSNPKFFIRLSKETKLDLHTWFNFLNHYNGKTFFLDEIWQNINSLQLYTDSSGTVGFGAVFKSHWCYGIWPKEWQNRNIAILESYPIVLSILLWGNMMQNQCIVFYTDNEALVHVINKCTCKDKIMMKFVRKLVLVCMEYNILFKARHVAGVRKELSCRCFISFADSKIPQTGIGQLRSAPHNNTTKITSDQLGPIVSKLLSSSLQKSSLPTYQRAWCLFRQFHASIFGNQTIQIPIDSTTLALFIAFLYEKEYASSTVQTYVSAISYYHKVAGLNDPTKTFYVMEMLKGYSKIGRKIDSRLPITLPILNSIMAACDMISSSNYERLRFKAMCSLAFFAFLRIGEMTVGNNSKSQNAVLQFNQIQMLPANDGKVNSFKVIFLNYKHHYNQQPFELIVSRHKTICPVDYLLRYFDVRGTNEGPLFIDGNRQAVSRSNFIKLLGQCLRACNLDPQRYKGHSFRIGAATYAAQNGLSDTRIRLLGRWKSEAFKKYIRIHSVISM